MPTRSVPAGGQGDATAAHAAPSTFARIRASQAGVDGETRLRRLLLALVVPDLVVVVVLVLSGAFVGAVVTVLAAGLALGAAVVLSPSEAPAVAAAPILGNEAVLGAQRDEMALLRARAAEAAVAVALQVELSYRHRSLLLRLLAHIDELEAHEADPAALAELFVLDHLATRMRRCSEGVLVLSGDPGSAAGGAPVAASEVLRGAVAAIEDFRRVEVSVERDVALDGGAAADLVHLLAEVVENATVFSADHTRVQVHGQGDPSGGYVVSVVDEGAGIAPEQAAALRTLLWTPPGTPLPPPQPGQLGYQVAARLARRRGIALSLDNNSPVGTIVTVAIPAALVVGGAPPSHAVPAHAPAAAVPLPDVAATAELTPITTQLPIPTPPPVPTPAPILTPMSAPVPEALPEPLAAELPAYVPEAIPFALPPENAAVAETADLASAAEAGFTGVTQAPVADWAGLPLPIELLPPLPEPADESPFAGYDESTLAGYDESTLAGYVDAHAADYAIPDDDEVWDAYPDDQLDAMIDGLLDVPAAGADPLGYDAPVPVPVFEAELAPEPEPEPSPGPELVSDAQLAPRPDLAEPAWQPPVRAVPDPAPEPFLAAAPALVPARGVPGRPGDGERTPAGLLRRTPQSHLAPHMADDPFEHVLPDDAAAVPAPDRSRALLSAYRDGLVLGRGGITPGDVRTHLDDRQSYDGVQDETGESA